MTLKRLKAITSGFKNIIFPSQYFEALAHERAKICSKCPELEPRMVFKIFERAFPESHVNRIDKDPHPQYLTTEKTIKGAGCKVCKCYLAAKVRQSLESCPLKKWE